MDVFNACKTETRVHNAVLTLLKTDGGFGFEIGESTRSAEKMINCMASYGFTFPTVAVTEDNFPPVADVPDPAPVKKAAEK